MLDSFVISAHTDGQTQCRIHVEPWKRQCSITVTVDRVIVRMGDESDISIRSFTWGDWHNIALWEQRAAALAKAFSPFWRGETVA